MALDERLKHELERAARPADPSGLYEHLIRRRERRRIARKVQTAGLVIVVLVGTAAGLFVLSKVFQTGSQRPGAGVTNGRVAFVNFDAARAIPDITAGWAIYTMKPDGSDLMFIGPPGVDEALYPTYSPDGSRIAFAGFTADPEERALYVMDSDGASVSRIFALDERHQINGLAWSPDGSRIGMLYTELVPTGGSETGVRDLDVVSTIWTIAPDGSDPRQVTTVGREGDFSWSPDGAQIVFSRHEPISPGEQYVANDIYIIGAAGGGETQVTRDGISMSPAWSPDGSLIAFESYEPEAGPGTDLYVMNADGTNRRRVTSDPGSEYGAVWSPDGSLIAYAERVIGDSDGSDCVVSLIRADGLDRDRIFRTPDVEGCPGQFGIAWAPAAPPPAETMTATATPSVEPSPSPTEDPMPDGTEDIGIGFPVCFAERLGGIDFLGDGTDGNAWTAVPVKDDGTCPKFRGPSDRYLLAVDHTGDRVADSWIDLPFECWNLCWPFDATDFDGNGTEELVVVNSFSIMDYSVFAVRRGANGDLLVEPIRVAAPGHEPAGISAGEPLRIDAGGDAGYSSSIECEGYPSAPVIVWSWSFAEIDSDEPAEVHVTRIELRPDGLFHVTGTNDFTVPAGAPSGIANPYELGPECGVDWYR